MSKKSEILSGIQEYAAKLTEQFDHSRATFKFRGAMPNFATDDLKKILEHINVMLSSQYGIKIQQLSRKNSERDQYVLSHKHAFDQNNFSAKNPSGNVLVIADDSDLVELII